MACERSNSGGRKPRDAGVTPQSVSGTAVEAISYDEGVDSTNGDTWTEVSQNGGQDWTQSFTNVLGQQYKTVKSTTGGGTATAITTFDSNGRPIKYVDFDGTITLTTYNPTTGQPMAQVQDNNGDGTYTPGVDAKTVISDTPVSSDDSDFAGETDSDLSDTGGGADFEGSSNAGLTQKSTVNGQTTTTNTVFTGTPGGSIVTTTNPDGTQIVDTYTQGVLTQEQQLGTNGSVITATTYGYDSLQRNTSITDWTGTTTFTLRPDGSIATETLPDGRTETVNTTDQKTQAPTSTTLADSGQPSQTVNQPVDALGRETSQSGAGVLPTVYTYDDGNGLGQLASLTTYQSGTLNGSGAATTRFAYDPDTGLLTSKTYADGSAQSFAYNNKGQLTSTTLPGGTVAGNFTYDSGGRLSESSYSDSATGQSAADYVDDYDDQNRPTVLTDDTAGGPNGAVSTTTALSYTNQNQLQSETTGSTGVTVKYTYFQPGDTTPSAEPGAIATMKLVQGSTTLAEYDYAYDPISKRLLSITLKGANGGADQVYTYGYQPSTNLVSSVAATGVNTSYTYDPTTGRLQSINAIDTATDQTVYNAVYAYNENNQQTSVTISRLNADGTSQTYVTSYTYNAANELTGASSTATVGTAPPSQSYTYDGVGNITNLGLGSVNSLNQYSSLTYNTRGDLTNDGTNAYGYDPEDRLNSVTPDNPTAASQKLIFEYDAEGRRTEKDVYAYSGNAWVFSYARRWAYSGPNAVAEFDGNNTLLKTFTWGQNNQLLAITDYTGSTPKVYNTILDAQGNVVALTDATGAVVASYTYDPYGKLLSAIGSAASECPFLYGGGYRDSESGLILLGARYYSPALGRFLTRDPSGESGGENLYAYGNGDPINQTDPTGLDPHRDKVWTEAKQEVAQRWYSTPSNYIDPNDAQALQNAYTNDPAFRQATDWVADQKEQWYIDDAPNRAARAEADQLAAGYDAHTGFGVGLEAGLANVANIATFGQIDDLSAKRQELWIGMRGTWTETLSNGAAYVGVAALGSAFALDVAGTFGLSEIGTVGLSTLPSQIGVEAYTAVVFGSPFAYRAIFSSNNDQTITLLNGTQWTSQPAPTTSLSPQMPSEAEAGANQGFVPFDQVTINGRG